MRYRLMPIVLGLASLIAPAMLCADEWERAVLRGEKLGDQADQTVPKQKPRQKLFKGYGYYKEPLEKICQSLDQDGRREIFFQLVNSRTERDPECVACRPLFKALADACKPKKVKPNRKPVDPMTVQITPEYKKPKQREPSLALVQRVQETFRAVAEDGTIRIESLAAVERLVGLLTDPNGKLPGEHDYFIVFAQYAWAPFEQLAKQRDREAGRGEAAPKPAASGVDDLFDK